ncbi:MAG: ABC transporter permease, partial [Gemmatimonadetes bacterium]|nr:ABC transporter permease [Gemmatimonadota bacterium]
MPEYISTGEIVFLSIMRFWPAWLAIAVCVGGGWFVRERLGVFGRLYDSRIGMAGL